MKPIAVLGLAAALIAAVPVRLPGPPPAKMRGVCWEGASEIEPSRLDPLKDLGVDWISETPFGWVPSAGSSTVRFSGERGLWGETDEGLVKTAVWARARGIKTLLKPHLWVRYADWPGDIKMSTEDGWAAWFASYESFILHHARLAEANGFEALAVGTELGGTTGREREWRALIAKVRGVYHGKLTYCANWNSEPERVAFWDALDFIGIQAYYPLSPKASPAKAEIEAGWAPVAASLEGLSKKTGKPVVFTELGFKSCLYALKEPWKWDADGEVDMEVQRNAYEATFATFWPKSWFAGAFVWKWHPVPQAVMHGNRDFTPQGKPALEVIRTYYLAGRRSESSR
jgi:hypothetical protein